VGSGTGSRAGGTRGSGARQLERKWGHSPFASKRGRTCVPFSFLRRAIGLIIPLA
jgi:hypothetical protein